LPQDEEAQISLLDIGKNSVKMKNDRQTGVVHAPSSKKKTDLEKKSTKKTVF
jgi:hypothetical protein